MSCFDASLPNPTLFGLDFINPTDHESVDELVPVDLEAVMSSVDGTMPVVLVLVHSSPRQLQAIDWAIAELNRASGEVEYRGLETIWQPEPAAQSEASDVDSFDRGTPIELAIEPREQEDTDPDAR